MRINSTLYLRAVGCQSLCTKNHTRHSSITFEYERKELCRGLAYKKEPNPIPARHQSSMHEEGGTKGTVCLAHPSPTSSLSALPKPSALIWFRDNTFYTLKLKHRV